MEAPALVKNLCCGLGFVLADVLSVLASMPPVAVTSDSVASDVIAPTMLSFNVCPGFLFCDSSALSSPGSMIGIFSFRTYLLIKRMERVTRAKSQALKTASKAATHLDARTTKVPNPLSHCSVSLTAAGLDYAVKVEQFAGSAVELVSVLCADLKLILTFTQGFSLPPSMPGIVPLGNQATGVCYAPALGSAGLRSRCPSYKALLAAIAAGARPHTCPTVACCVEKFLQLSARLVGCGDSPPKEVAEEQVMSLVLCTSFDSYLVCRICSACPPVG